MKYHKRHIEQKLFQLFENFKVVLVVGARQVGKSTLLKNIFPNLRLLTFDPVQDLYGAREDPDLFLSNFPGPIILDEIQYVPQLLPALKRRVDLSDENGQFILTGSQNLSLLKSVSESLAGRVGILHLRTMTAYEIEEENYSETQANWLERFLKTPASFKNEFVSLLSTEKTLYEFIWRGAYPGLLHKQNKIIPTYFNSYLQTYVERDVRLVEDIKDLSTFGDFLALLSHHTAQEINESHLGRELGIHRSTCQKWKEVLKNTYLWHELLPYFGNAVKRLSKKKKGYMGDTGLSCYLQRISSPEALATHPMVGALFETWVVHHILAFSEGMETPPHLYHWRTNGGAEVDLVLERNGALHPVEIKCRSHISKKDISGIQAFFETYPNSSSHGLVIYAGEDCFQISDNITVLPWNALLHKNQK